MGGPLDSGPIAGGPLSASLIHFIIWGGHHQFGATVLKVAWAKGFLVEVMISFLLMFVIVRVMMAPHTLKKHAGTFVGLTVTLCIFVADPLTSGSMNPVRTFGPAIFSKN